MSNDTALAVVQPQDFNAQQVEIIRNQIAKGATEGELSLFLEVCKMTGLNPFMKQIYAIKRGQNMTIQTGIDGYRLVAARTKHLAGIDDPIYDTEDADNPNRATVTVWRFINGQRVPFTATARWKEYGQTTGLWPKMPYHMLGKCAEALALRKAFPAELSGVYTGEEMEQANNGAPYVEATPAPTARRMSQPQTHIQEQPVPAPAPVGKVPSWSALRMLGNELGWSEANYNRALKDFVGDKPAEQYTNADKAKWELHLRKQLSRKNAPRTLGTDVIEDETLTPDPEQPHDLTQLDGGRISA